MADIKKVLLVDDEESTTEYALMVIEEYEDEFEVVIAHNGQEGLEKFKEAKQKGAGFDYIVSDVTMPVMTGIEMVKEIKKIDQDVKVVMLTAHSKFDLHYMSELDALKADHILHKPFLITKLFEEVLV